jgi:putative hydrolase of the HAD superfamily
MLKGILFDFDDTLYNYHNSNSIALTALFENISKNHLLDISVIEEKYNKINKDVKVSNNHAIKFNKIIYIKLLLSELNIHVYRLEQYINIYNTEFYKNLELFDKVVDVLQLLKDNHIKMAICSNNNFQQQYNKLVYTGIIKYFDVIETSDIHSEEKPHPNLISSIIQKMDIESHYCGYLGDNYDHDVASGLKNKMMCFHFIKGCTFCVKEKYIEYGNYDDLYQFLFCYFQSSREILFLSKYFGQSVLNTQGPGSNISVKFGKCMFIKSSGAVLGNMTEYNGYCMVNNESVLKQVNDCDVTGKDIETCKIYGNSKPSMETYFHCFLDKYTVHLHFTLANIFLCSDSILALNNIKYPFVVIDYYQPGLLLAKEILKKKENDCVIYFLKNHGIILCHDNMNMIIEIYEYLFHYFDNLLNNQYKNHFNSFLINKYSYFYHNKSMVVKYIDYNAEILKNIVYCFPDLAIFIQNSKIIEKEMDIEDCIQKDGKQYDIIIVEDCVYVIAETLQKVYNIIEILDTYAILKRYNICSIDNITDLQNMEQEKQRIRLI